MSKLPPNCGEVSSTTSAIAPDVAKPDTIADRAIFLRPPPDVSTARNTSSLATVDISDKALTAIELKFVPSATSKLPAVLVPIVISSPDTVKSPDIVKFLNPVKSLLESTPSVVGDKVKLKSLEGEPPSLIDKEPGCSFAPRCPYREESCNPKLDMELVEVAPDHFVDACSVGKK